MSTLDTISKSFVYAGMSPTISKEQKKRGKKKRSFDEGEEKEEQRTKRRVFATKSRDKEEQSWGQELNPTSH